MKQKIARSRAWNGAALFTLTCLSASSTLAANLYWDLDGANPGPGFLGGTWDTSTANWSASPAGDVITQVWSNTPGTDLAIFSAGDLGAAAGAYTVTLTGSVSADPGAVAAGIVVKDGRLTFNGEFFASAVSIGAGSVTVGSGAELVFDHAARILATAGSSFSLMGGTLTTTNSGLTGSFVDVDSTISLGAQGGTFRAMAVNSMNIVQTNSVISGPGDLRKTGPGVISVASASTYTGATIIEDGELRVRSSANRYPVTTAVTVISPGIFNLNGVNQQIGSLSGNGAVGLGNGTLTIDGSSDTVFSGTIDNIRNASENGVTTGNGKLVKNGTGSLTLEGLNSYTGSFTLNAGTVTVTANGSLSGPTADVTINGGVLNLNNPAQTIENLNGTGGTINLAPGHVLTTDPVADATYAGTIAGAGSFVKANVLSGATNRALTLNGNNTYLGETTVSGGTLLVNGSIAGTASVTVSGTLGGLGTVAPLIDGGVTFSATGKLAPGTNAIDVLIGVLTFELSGDGTVDLIDAIDASSGALLFELGALAASDKVVLTGGPLTIGSQLLGLEDFTFTILAGFEGGDYLLFDGDTAIAGSLGPGAIGLVNGFAAELQFADGGKDIVLHVVPEPGAATFLLAGLGALVARRRRP